MNYSEMLKQKLSAQSALMKVAIDANRAMTEDEQKQFTGLENEIVSLEKTIEAQEKINAREIEAKTVVNEPIYAVPKDPNAKAWKNMGEFLHAVRRAAAPDRVVDPRLTIKDAASGASEGVPSDGGFLVQQDYAAELLKRTYETGVLAPKCRKIPISANANSLKINTVDENSRANGSRWGGIQSYWINEADLFTGSKPKFGQIEMSLKKLTGLCYATDELLQDSTAMEAVISQAFAEEFGFKMDDAIVRGTGAGQPMGILNSAALITVAKTASQTADTFTFNNAQDMWMRMYPKGRANSVWYINQELEAQLNKMTIATGTYSGATVYMPPTGIAGGSYSTLFGRPVMPIEQCAALGDAGDIILADLSQYLLIDKGGINSASSIHIRFLYDESVFRFIYRVDGQPIWKMPLTPYKGSMTMSPFVTLAERA
jgi:HK97 family phage major capsid protein